MTVRRDGPRGPERDGFHGGVVVRVFAHGTAWPRVLPSLPDDATASVTVSHDRLAEIPTATLRRCGYRIAGVSPVPDPDAGEVVDVLATAALRRAHPSWFRSLVDVATRVFDLRFGPVRRLLAPTLRAHAAGR